MAKQNGAQFPEQSDIESLIDIVKDIELNTRHTKGNLMRTPKYEDFSKNLGNLDMIVPMGFLMLHNDLQELITDSKGKLKHTSADGGSTEIDLAGAIGSIAGLAGVIGGSVIIGNLTKDMNLRDVAQVAMELGDWVVNKIPDISDNLSYLVKTVVPALAEVLPTISENVNEAVGITGRGLASTVMDVKDIIVDDEINAQRKDLLKTYLNLNYAQLYNDLGYEAVLDTSGNIVGIQKLAERAIDLFEGVEEDTSFKDTVKAFGKNVVNSVANDVKNGAIGETVGSTIYGFKTAKIKSYTNLIQEELPQTILTAINAIDLTTDPELLQASKDASKYYIMAYYGNLIARMGFLVDYEKETVTRALDWSEFYSEAKTLIGDVLNGGKTLQIESVAQSLGNSLTTIVGSLTSLEMLGQGPTEAVKEGYGMYIKAYYANLIARMGFLVDYEKGTLTRAYTDPAYAVAEAKILVGDVLSGGVGLMVESVAQSLGNSISTISASLTSIDSIGTGASEDIKEAYGMYIKAYYANLIAGFGYDVDYNTGTLTRVSSFESVQNKVIDVVGDFIYAPLTMLSNAVGKSISAISSAVSTSEFNSSLQNSVLDYVNKVYMESTGISEAIEELEDFVTAFFRGLYEQISDKPNDFKLDRGERNILKNSFAQAMGKISANLSDTVNTEIQNKVDVTLNSVFTETRVASLLSKIESIDNRLSTIKISMGNTIGTDVKTIAEKPTSNTTITKQPSTVGTDDMKTAGEIV